MWEMTLPGQLGRMGRLLEARIAPPVYHRTPTVTLSTSSKRELVHDLGFKDHLVHVVPPGIDPRFSPGGSKSPTPLVVAAGRLVPVKRFDLLIDALVANKVAHPGLEAVIVGEGYRRDLLETRIHEAGAERWIHLPGRVGDEELVDLYRRAWLLASASAREGWGMTLTEAAACGTPAVASRIAGHLDAVDEGRSGLLADGRDELAAAIGRVLSDADLRARLTAGAREHATRFRWAATARGTLEVLAAEAMLRHRHP
jgi:glycosyltransferase involved in cell wall biosynthesis